VTPIIINISLIPAIPRYYFTRDDHLLTRFYFF
jgi:hypothetical protein